MMETSPLPGEQPLRRWHWLALGLFALILIAFGGITVMRAAFLSERRTDFGVYARAAWAVRNGQDPYTITDNRGWHYCYPPPLAILMAPLADPPADQPQGAYLPFAVSVGIWYVLGFLAAFYAIHAFAQATLPDAVPGTQRWWSARIAPLLYSIAGVGLTVSRGQVNTLVVALWAAALLASVRMKPVASGLWFGAAACLKAIPGLVLLLPLVRRDWRVFAGAALAAFLFLGVLPLLTVGLDGTIEFNRKTIQLILAPGATGQADETRAKELFQATSTDNQSFQAMINAWYHPNFWTRPNEFHPWAKRGHWILSFALLALTVFGLIRNGMPQPVHRLLGLGLLATVMLLMTPVSHMHYYAFALPLVSGLWIHGLLQRPGRVLPPWATMIPLLLWCTVIATSLIPIPYWKEWRQYGTCTIATTLLWLVGFVTLVRNSKHEIRSTKFERKTSLFQVTLSRNS